MDLKQDHEFATQLRALIVLRRNIQKLCFSTTCYIDRYNPSFTFLTTKQKTQLTRLLTVASGFIACFGTPRASYYHPMPAPDSKCLPDCVAWLSSPYLLQPFQDICNELVNGTTMLDGVKISPIKFSPSTIYSRGPSRSMVELADRIITAEMILTHANAKVGPSDDVRDSQLSAR
jgi:hypothetical protein